MFEMQESVIASDDVRWNAIMDSITKWNVTGRAAYIYSVCASAEVATEIKELCEYSNGGFSTGRHAIEFD
jgi:hypothetical protein